MIAPASSGRDRQRAEPKWAHKKPHFQLGNGGFVEFKRVIGGISARPRRVTRLDLIEPHALDKLETVRGEGIEVGSFALKIQYVDQVQAFGTALYHAHGIGLALHGPVAYVVGRPVIGIYTNGIIQKRTCRSSFGKSVISYFHKMRGLKSPTV